LLTQISGAEEDLLASFAKLHLANNSKAHRKYRAVPQLVRKQSLKTHESAQKRSQERDKFAIKIS